MIFAFITLVIIVQVPEYVKKKHKYYLEREEYGLDFYRVYELGLSRREDQEQCKNQVESLKSASCWRPDTFYLPCSLHPAQG